MPAKGDKTDTILAIFFKRGSVNDFVLAGRQSALVIKVSGYLHSKKVTERLGSSFTVKSSA